MDKVNFDNEDNKDDDESSGDEMLNVEFDQFVNAHHITEEVEEDKGLYLVEEEDVDPHLVEEEEEDKDSWAIPQLRQILLLVRPPTMLLPPMTTTMESTAMVLPQMIQADDHVHLAVLWMLLAQFVCLIVPMDLLVYFSLPRDHSQVEFMQHWAIAITPIGFV